MVLSDFGFWVLLGCCQNSVLHRFRLLGMVSGGRVDDEVFV